MKNLHLTALLVLLHAPLAHAVSDGKPFQVSGERVEIDLPANWKLAWMEGKPDADYLVEYIHESDEINSWKRGYLTIQRRAYPPREVRDEIAKAKARVADLALRQTVNAAAQACPNQHEPTSQRVNTFNGLYIAVGGGYCSQDKGINRYGEGAFIGFVEGKDYYYLIQYGWRPQNEAEKMSSPWGIDEKTAKAYLATYKTISLCDDVNTPCKHPYVQ